MNVAKQKQTHKYREKISCYQWGEGRGEGTGEGKDRCRGLTGTNYYV